MLLGPDGNPIVAPDDARVYPVGEYFADGLAAIGGYPQVLPGTPDELMLEHQRQGGKIPYVVAALWQATSLTFEQIEDHINTAFVEPSRELAQEVMRLRAELDALREDVRVLRRRLRDVRDEYRRLRDVLSAEE